MKYQIVCKNLTTDDKRIEKVGLVDYGSSSPAKYQRTPKQINEMIGNGNQCFVTNEAGKETEVEQFGDDFIRTKKDGTIKNNLRHLRDCNFS